MSQETLENLLREERRFPPSPEFAAQAVAKAELYDEAAADRLAFWDRAGARADVGHAVGADARLERRARSRSGSSAASSTSPTTASTGTSRPATATGSPSTSRASRATPARSPTPTCSARCARRPTRCGARRRGRRPRRDLHADDPRGGDRDARLRPASARRTPSSSAASPPRRCRSRIEDAEAKLVITADGGYRRGAPSALKPAVDEALAACARRSERARRPAHRAGRRVERRRDVWWHDVVDAALRRARGAGVRRRAPAVHPLHLGHDREAEGHPPHHRRLPDAGRLHPPRRLRPATPRPTSTGARPTSAG